MWGTITVAFYSAINHDSLSTSLRFPYHNSLYIASFMIKLNTAKTSFLGGWRFLSWKILGNNKNNTSQSKTQRIHVCIFTYIYHKNQPKVGKIPYMDPMGKEFPFQFQSSDSLAWCLPLAAFLRHTVGSHDGPISPGAKSLALNKGSASSHNIFWHLMLLRISLGDWTWLQSRKSGSFTSKHWKKTKPCYINQLSCQKTPFTALDSKTALLFQEPKYYTILSKDIGQQGPGRPPKTATPSSCSRISMSKKHCLNAPPNQDVRMSIVFVWTLTI